MSFNFQENFEIAKEKYNQKLYSEAFDEIITLMLSLFTHPDVNASPIEIITLAAACYKNIDPSRAEEILKNDQLEPLEQYFAIVRDYQDHKEEKNEKFVQDEIHLFIHPDVAQIRENSFNEIPLEAKTIKVGEYNTAIVTSQGPRDVMEDNYVTNILDLSVGENKYTIPFFALMDGHGGAGCANYVHDHLTQVLTDEMNKITGFTNLEIYNALCRTFAQVHDNWKLSNIKKDKKNKDWSGTTLLLALIIDDKTLWIANAGDSRAILGQANKTYQLSDDAKATKEFYQNKIISRGGSIICGRVDGNLGMTQAIGDLHHPSISPRPQIRQIDLVHLQPGEQNILILATDGLWDVIGSEQAIQLANGNPILEIAEELQTSAYALGSWDNITIAVVNLNASISEQ